MEIGIPRPVDVKMSDHLVALELENANLRRIISLLVIQAGGIVYFSEVDQASFYDKQEVISYQNKITGEWILEVK